MMSSDSSPVKRSGRKRKKIEDSDTESHNEETPIRKVIMKGEREEEEEEEGEEGSKGKVISTKTRKKIQNIHIATPRVTESSKKKNIPIR